MTKKQFGIKLSKLMQKLYNEKWFQPGYFTSYLIDDIFNCMITDSDDVKQIAYELKINLNKPIKLSLQELQIIDTFITDRIRNSVITDMLQQTQEYIELCMLRMQQVTTKNSKNKFYFNSSMTKQIWVILNDYACDEVAEEPICGWKKFNKLTHKFINFNQHVIEG